MALRIGETFAGYRVLRLLGSGGMGDVYLVQHPRLPRHEALKVLRPDISSLPSFRERFIREADMAAGLRHPHVVGIHDRGEHDGQLWIAMDYVDGADLAHLVEQRYPAGMPIDFVLSIITAVASALDYAHKKSLLHRDVKPANIIVADLETDDPSVFLADFGIARPLDDTSGITTTNMTVGTVAYAAPEQLLGEAIDGRADEYALAATCYQLLTGNQLFPHTNPAVVIGRHLNTAPPKLGDVRSDLSSLDGALRQALAKDPADRYPTCNAFAHFLALKSPSQHPVSPSARTLAAPRPNKKRLRPSSGSVKKPSITGASRARTRPRVVVITAAAAVLLIGIGALAARTLQGSDPLASETPSATTRSSVTSGPLSSNSAAPSSPAETTQTTPSRSEVADVSPSAVPATSRCAAPSGSSRAAVIGCSCNLGSGSTVTSDGTPAYCRQLLGVDIPVGFWMSRNADVPAPTVPGDFNMYVCESQLGLSSNECAVHLAHYSYAGDGEPSY